MRTFSCACLGECGRLPHLPLCVHGVGLQSARGAPPALYPLALPLPNHPVDFSLKWQSGLPYSETTFADVFLAQGILPRTCVGCAQHGCLGCLKFCM